MRDQMEQLGHEIPDVNIEALQGGKGSEGECWAQEVSNVAIDALHDCSDGLVLKAIVGPTKFPMLP